MPRFTKSCGVSGPSLQSPAGYQAPRNKVLWGIKPWGTTFKYEFEKELGNILGCEFGDYMGSIRGNNRGRKSYATVPLSWILELLIVIVGNKIQLGGGGGLQH
jgi:hypothetical protein